MSIGAPLDGRASGLYRPRQDSIPIALVAARAAASFNRVYPESGSAPLPADSEERIAAEMTTNDYTPDSG